MRIGPYQLESNLLMAPMAGVTDLPFRRLVRSFGASLAVSEMISSDSTLWGSRKSQRRLNWEGEQPPISVQILGSTPGTMAEAARITADYGAHIVDINMGCPAKKVCKAAAGSALLKDERLVGQILDAVVNAVDIPVTLKIRTGWDQDQRNGIQIAKIAEQAGIQALAIHGRTRACGFGGEAEYDTIRDIKQIVNIPVIANGDIRSPEKAKQVLEFTGADGIMIGRGAQGRPWIFREIEQFLNTGQKIDIFTPTLAHQILRQHLEEIYEFYGLEHGVKIARKHIAWYSKQLPGGAQFRARINQADTAKEQRALIDVFFNKLKTTSELAA